MEDRGRASNGLPYDAAIGGEKGEPWLRAEIDAVVEAYTRMLRMEHRGERYSKATVVRTIASRLPARSVASIERKFQNISAVRDDAGLQWIDGYKPLSHFQRELRDVVLGSARRDHRLSEALADYGSTPIVAPQPRRLTTEDVVVAPPQPRASGRGQSVVRLTGSAMNAMQDFRASQLGKAGEEWVFDLEREKLDRLGRSDLAGRVTWTARDEGDGAGYDVTSYREDGRARLIEVKTTNYGPRTPFYITRWEIEVSRQNPDSYSLYRVHGFARDPRIYILDGSVEERARLEPKIFMGIPL